MRNIIIFYLIFISTTPTIAADTIAASTETVNINWSGGYLGAHAGYGWGRSHDVNNPQADEQKPSGGFGGLQAGYNWQLDNNLVLGTEADISFGSIKKNWGGANEYDPYYGSDKLGTNGTVRARIGYAINHILPYITGGFAWGQTKYSLGCNSDRVGGNTIGGCTKVGAFEDRSQETATGWTAGAGLEYAVNDNWSIKGEYLYKDFGETAIRLTDINYPTSDVNNRRFKTTINEIRLGINYKF